MVRLAALALALAVLSLAYAAPAWAGFGFLGAWGTVGSGPGQFALPDGIAVDNGGSVWVADRDNNRIQKFTADGRYLPFPAFRHQGPSPKPGRINYPYKALPDALGNLYVADGHNNRIQEFSPTGKLIRTFGKRGSGPGELWQPRGLAIDPFGNLWVADHENARVVKFSRTGRFLGMWGAHGADGSYGGGWGEFNSPRGLSSDSKGNIYVADDANHRIVKMANDGTVLALWGRPDLRPGTADGEFALPYGTAVDPSDHVWVADTVNNRLVKLTTDGQVLAKYGANGGDGSAGGGPGEFNQIYNVATDCVGNVYATDNKNWRVQKFGDPSFRRPVCPPKIAVGALTVKPGVVTAELSCDRPCRARATAVVRLAGQPKRSVRGSERLRWSAGKIVVSVRVPRRVGTAVVRLTGSGAPGATSAVKRTVKLR
jgi:sugar lactone lactonase YvrE